MDKLRVLSIIHGPEKRHAAGRTTNRKRDPVMGADDKVQNSAEKLGGKVKEGLGKATGNESMEAEGHGDQAKGSAKQAGENIKDAFKGK